MELVPFFVQIFTQPAFNKAHQVLLPPSRAFQTPKFIRRALQNLSTARRQSVVRPGKGDKVETCLFYWWKFGSPLQPNRQFIFHSRVRVCMWEHVWRKLFLLCPKIWRTHTCPNNIVKTPVPWPAFGHHKFYYFEGEKVLGKRRGEEVEIKSRRIFCWFTGTFVVYAICIAA